MVINWTIATTHAHNWFWTAVPDMFSKQLSFPKRRASPTLPLRKTRNAFYWRHGVTQFCKMAHKRKTFGHVAEHIPQYAKTVKGMRDKAS